MSDSIRKARVLKGMSQSRVAEQLNITQASYARLESGQTKLSLERIQQLAKIFELSPEYFVGLDGHKPEFGSDFHLTNEYIKKLVETNGELRLKLEHLISTQINYLQEQNKLLLEILAIRSQSE